MNIGTPAVSVCIFSYNYECYIAQAIESVLQQRVKFSFEIVVGDDLSTDTTREIILQFQQKYPEIIKLSFNTENIGGTRNWIKTINQCSGKYVALLDGDDYFTDEFKLQKQFDCLERESNGVLCFHAIDEVYEGLPGKNATIRFDQRIYTIKDFLAKGWFIRTGSTFFRNKILPEVPPVWVYDFPYRYDTILHVFLTMHGDAYYLDEVMSVWRKHVNGMSRKLAENTIRGIVAEIEMEKQLSLYTGNKYRAITKKYCKSFYSALFLEIIRNGKLISHGLMFIESIVKMDWGVTFSRTINKMRKSL